METARIIKCKPEFYYDYFSLDQVSTEQWHRSFYWPVHREITTQITIDIHNKFKEMVNRLGRSFEGDCLLISYAMSYKIIAVLNHYLCVQRILSNNQSIIHSKDLKIIPKLIQGGMEGYNDINIWSIDTKKNSKRPFKNLLRSIQYNFQNARYSVFNHIEKNKGIFCFLDMTLMERDFIRKKPHWLRLTSYEDWYTPLKNTPVAPPIKKALHDISIDLAKFIKDYMEINFGIPFPEKIKLPLQNYIFLCLESIATVYQNILERVEKVCPRQIYTPTAGKTFIRALSLAIRKYGGKVSGFPHGYYICHYSSPRPSFHELSTVDEFVAFTPGSVPLIKRNLSINPPARNNSVKIVHENSNRLLEHYTKWSARSLPDKIETVMVVELSLISEWAGYHCADSMVNYHFYYSLCKILSKNGYKIIFKRRPKAPNWNGLNIFKDIKNVDIIYKPFEEPGVIDSADAIIIQYAMSSTLFWSMCTNKTVIYADAGWEPWFNDVYKLMKKRCRILSCWYDELNRQCFHEQELLELLKKPDKNINTEFLEKYLFPAQP